AGLDRSRQLAARGDRCRGPSAHVRAESDRIGILGLALGHARDPGSIDGALHQRRPDGRGSDAVGIRGYRLDRSNSAVPVGTTPPAITRAFAAPNPFSAGTAIKFALRQSGPARIEIFDLGGRLVKSLPMAWRPVGPQSADWDG